MKRFILLGITILATLTSLYGRGYTVDQIPNVQVADSRNFVSNPDNILSPQAVATIDQLCLELRNNAIAQVAVVAVDKIEGGDLFEFGYELFSKWGVGRKENNNGLGIILSTDLREVRFLTGYGVEGVLTDATCKQIQRKYMIPYFRQGDYSGGMVAGIEAINALLRGSELDLGGSDIVKRPSGSQFSILSLVIMFIAASMLLSYFENRRKTKCPKCGKHTLKLVSNTIVSTTSHHNTVEHSYYCTNCGNRTNRRYREERDDLDAAIGGAIIGSTLFGRGGSFGSGGGFGGGGFGGGFGGGGFGGGGAGSSW